MAIRPIRILALCAGVGGIELGIRLAVPSARCVCYVEGEAYAAAVLVARMGDQALDEAPVWSDVGTFDGVPWRGVVDLVTAGYPCQPFSGAGRRRGEEDECHLWPHVRRIVGEVQPQRCFFENVARHLRVGFEQVHDDLLAMGYGVKAGLFTAAEVGAPHQRERLFVLADRGGVGLVRGEEQDEQQAGGEQAPRRDDADGPPAGAARRWWEAGYGPAPEPLLRRVDDGMAHRVDRVRACGNGVVPLVACHAWRVLTGSTV